MLRAVSRIALAIILLFAFSGCVLPAQVSSTPPSTPIVVPPVTTVEIIRDVEYGMGDNVTLLLDLYIPRTPIFTPMPAVIFIHGGGWQGGDKYPSQVRTLAERGFFGVSINYRLSGVAPFPAAVEDCKCAVRWLRANVPEYNIDPNRIGVWGGSAGGHLALMVGCADTSAGLEGSGGWASQSSRVQAICSYYGPADLTRIIEDGNRDAPTLFLAGTPQEKPEAYRLASPVTHVSRDDPPLLMVHGELDRTVPFNQSERMYQAYSQLGLNVTLVKVLNADHGFKPVGGAIISPTLAEINQLVLEFFLKYLCARP